MAKKTNRKKDNSKKAGLLAFGGTLLVYALLFPFRKPFHFLIGGGLAALAGWVAKTMATPMKGLDKNAKTKEALNVTVIEDEYARGVIEKGVEMLDRFKAEKEAVNEYVFSRRIDQIRANLDKVLRQIIDDPDKAHRIRKINSYYLPTALKLLEGYRTAKQQGTSYMTVSQTREDILSTLDQLNDALAEDEVTDALRQSAHAAAKEIPMSKAPDMKAAAPVMNTPNTTASARQLQQGTPVLRVPQAPTAPDFSHESNQQTKA